MGMTWHCVDGLVDDATIRRCLDRPVCDTYIDPENDTQQSMAAECDINNIMRQYEQTGLIAHVNQYEGEYGDFTDVVDYQTACNVVMMANEMFSTLPSAVRARFQNDPSAFLAFVDNPDNKEEMVKLGLSRVRDQSDADRIVDAIRNSDGDRSDVAGSPDSKVGVKGPTPSDSRA